MPDLKTALTNAIQEKQMNNDTITREQIMQTIAGWADDENEAPVTPPTPAVSTVGAPTVKELVEAKMLHSVYTGYLSRDIFSYVSNNPNSRVRDVVKAMQALPYSYNVQSIGTLLTQMVKTGLMFRKDGHYKTLTATYRPIGKPSRTYKASTRAPKPLPPNAKVKHKKVKVAVEAEIKAPVPKLSMTHDLDQLLAQLTFTQAIELYKKLRDTLGSATRMPLP